jgi:heterodisulfide reductase subunit A
VVLTYTTEDGQQVETGFDMVVLAIGLEAPRDAMALADRFGIELTRYRFAKTGSFAPVSTTREGVFVTGAFHSPKAIPKSVIFASTAAAEVGSLLAPSKGSLTREKTWPPETDISGREPAVGVFVCSCGTNIAGVVDVKAVAAYAATLPGVVHVENNLFTCSTDTQDLIARTVKEKGLNRVVIAACTPRTHEPLFQETLQGIGLNKYMIEMANIRNQNAWVHPGEPDKATAKARDQVRMAVAKVLMNYPLEDVAVSVTPRALVIGAGLAGLSAALGLASQGYETVVLEKTARPGGVALDLFETWKGESIRQGLANVLDQVRSHPGIRLLTQAELTAVSGSVGSFVGEVRHGDTSETLEFGACVIATGGRSYTPSEYGYGGHPGVVTSLEFDRILAENMDRALEADSTVFIQCVGSRDAERPYCSRLCCTSSVSAAIELKTRKPAMDVYVLYRDIRTYGDREDLFRRARDLGVLFIHYTPETRPEVGLEDGLGVKVLDRISGFRLDIRADRVVLATAVLPNDTTALVEMFKCGVNADGFLNEAHPKLRPVDSTVDGVFIAGLCHYPKPVNEAVAQGKAAASRAGVILSRKTMKLDAIKSHATHNCDGCALCLDVCPYHAISLVEYEDGGRIRRHIDTDRALCKGCGICAATCPKEGVVVDGFTPGQLRAQVDAILAR